MAGTRTQTMDRSVKVILEDGTVIVGLWHSRVCNYKVASSSNLQLMYQSRHSDKFRRLPFFRNCHSVHTDVGSLFEEK